MISALTHTTLEMIAAATGRKHSMVAKQAKKEGWEFEVEPGSARRRWYPIASLPKAVREAIQAKQLSAIFEAQKQFPVAVAVTQKREAFSADGAMVRRGLIRRVKAEGRLTDVDKARRDGSLILCQAIEDATVGVRCSAKRAMRDLAESVMAGIAKKELIDAVTVTYIKPRKTGQTVDSLISRLQKMYAAYCQGRDEGDAARYLVPGTPEKTGQEPIHIHAFLIFYCRPARPPVTEAWRSAQSWFAAQNLPCPAVDTFYRIEKSLPVTIKYRGRMTGGQWRSLLPYVDRDVSMFKANDIWVGDGHSFKAKVRHPIHGNAFTPEVTLIIDWVSRKIVGWSVDLSESVIAVSAAFRHAQMVTRARPLVYYSDNGGGQTGKLIDCAIHGTLARQGIAHETGIPGNAQGRGIIERIWQVTLIPLARTYPTCTWKGADKEATRKMLVSLNKKDGSGENLLPTWEQFLRDIAQCVRQYNTTHEHRELNGSVPEAEYQARLDPDSVCCGPTDAEIDLMWMPEVSRTPQRGVVPLFGNEYANKLLVELLAEGEKVRVRFDIHNAERVWLLRMDGRTLCTAEWDAHKRAAFPVPYIEQKREERAAGKIRLAEKKIAEANAELGNVIEGESVPVKTIADFRDMNPAPVEAEPIKTRLDFLSEEKEEKQAIYMDTVQWLHGDGPDPREKGDKQGEVAAR